MYDSYMRTRRDLVLSMGAGILGGALLPCSSTSAYAQSIPVISINKEGRLYLNDKLVNINRLANEIRHAFPTATEVYFKADRQTPFDSVAQVLAALRAAKPSISARVVNQEIPKYPLPENSK